MNFDPEILAMSKSFEALKNLRKSQVKRVVVWISDRCGLTEGKECEEATFFTLEPEELKTEPVEEAEVEVEDEDEFEDEEIKGKKESKRGRKSDKDNEKEKKDLTDFDTVLDLFAESKVSKASSKILLMAAFLQEKQGFKEVSSYDINFRLRRIGHGIQNISSAINTVLKKKPALMIEVDKNSSERQSRRRLKVTPEGIKAARKLLH